MDVFMVFIKQQTYGNDWGSPSCRMREIPPGRLGIPLGQLVMIQLVARFFLDDSGIPLGNSRENDMK